MADELPSLQIDNDWKKQAQEEKRKLAEQEKQRTQPAPGAAPSGTIPGSAGGAASDPSMPAGGVRGAATPGMPQAGQLPAASFQTLVQSVVTQALYHLGELAVRGAEPVVNLDMAKHHIDTLEVLEKKTAKNLSEDEQKMLDAALYEARMRFVSVASQYIS